MSERLPIPTETWVLPRPRPDAYVGGFPLHFERKLWRLLGEPEKVLHPFGGLAEIGDRVDLNATTSPTFVGDAHDLAALGTDGSVRTVPLRQRVLRRPRRDAATDRHADPVPSAKGRLHRPGAFPSSRVDACFAGCRCLPSPRERHAAHVRDVGDRGGQRSPLAAREDHGHVSRAARGHVCALVERTDERLVAAFDAYDAAASPR